MIDVPVLKTEAAYYVEGKTKVEVSRNPSPIFEGIGPVMQEVTELIVHIPFDGDASVFNIVRSANNSLIAPQEVDGNELLLRVTVSEDNCGVQEQID
jgi:hypothetical protein